MKIALVGSSGGHLTHLKQLEPVWHKHDRFWVTFDKPDASSYLTEERWYKAYFPTNRNVFNLIRNTFVAFRVLLKERPDVIFKRSRCCSSVLLYWKVNWCKISLYRSVR